MVDLKLDTIAVPDTRNFTGLGCWVYNTEAKCLDMCQVTTHKVHNIKLEGPMTVLADVCKIFGFKPSLQNTCNQELGIPCLCV